MQWYADSLFTPGPRRPLNREQRRIWRARCEMQRRAGEITALHAKIGDFVLKRLGVDGQCTPCKVTIAADAGSCPRTVGEALRRFRRLGMLEWVRRVVRHRQQVRQTSNAYRFLLGDAPAREEKPKVSSSKASSARATTRLGLDEIESRDRQLAALREWETNSLPKHRQTVCLERADRHMLGGQTTEGKPWQTTTTGPSRR